MKSIDFFFDFASPYAWFALSGLQDLAKRHERVIRLRPMLLWAVLKERGMPPPLEHEAKKAYLLHDMQRSARFYGLPFRMPDAFPTSSHLPARLQLQLQAAQHPQAAAFADAVLTAYFTRNIDLRDASEICRIAAALGIEPQWAEEALASEHGRERLKQANAEALAAGVWGSPFIIVDDEPYFGADRLPQIARQLAGQ